ncbi:MAG: hypothetical protein ACLFQV_10685 [Vulcanimicrobiota bacterium]
METAYLKFPAGDKAEKAKKLMEEVNKVVEKMEQVDDVEGADLDDTQGGVKVKGLYDGEDRQYFGKLDYDFASGKPELMEVEIINPKTLDSYNLVYKCDHKDIPIFGSKKRLFQRISNSGGSARTKLVEEVKIEKDGTVKYDEYYADLMFYADYDQRPD